MGLFMATAENAGGVPTGRNNRSRRGKRSAGRPPSTVISGLPWKDPPGRQRGLTTAARRLPFPPCRREKTDVGVDRIKQIGRLCKNRAKTISALFARTKKCKKQRFSVNEKMSVTI